MRFIKKKLKLMLLKFIYMKNKKERIPKKDSIRPTGVKTIFPPNWTEPKKHICHDGSVILYGFTNIESNLKKQRFPVTDSIDNSQ